jgi:hypothetical protein
MAALTEDSSKGGQLMTDQQTFNAAYLAAQPPQLQALMAMPVDSEADIQSRVTAALSLAHQGFAIDNEIMGHGFDAFEVQSECIELDETWKPNMLQAQLGQEGGYALPGGNVLPGMLGPYPETMPPGWLIVSVNPADYPPFAPPTPPAPPAPQNNPIGPLLGTDSSGEQIFGNVPIPGFVVTDGMIYPNPTASPRYMAHVYQTPWGSELDWAKIG